MQKKRKKIEEDKHVHSVYIPRIRRRRCIDIRVCVHPHHERLRARSQDPRDAPRRNAVVTTHREHELARACGRRHGLVERATHAADVARALGTGDGVVGLGGGDGDVDVARDLDAREEKRRNISSEIFFFLKTEFFIILQL